jgi:hypothetical protein
MKGFDCLQEKIFLFPLAAPSRLGKKDKNKICLSRAACVPN